MLGRGLSVFRQTVRLLAPVVMVACTADTNVPTADVGGTAQLTAVPVQITISANVDTAIAGRLGGSAPISVHVADAVSGRPVVNQMVTFLSASGNGSVVRNGAVTTGSLTNATGDVVATWNFGGTAGEQLLRATVKNGIDTVWFVATLPAPTAFSAVSTTQIAGAYAGNTVVSVMAVDSAGDPFPSASVRFLVGAGSGKVSYPVVRTGLNGIAKTTWTFDSTVVGAQALFATVDGTTDTLEFDATVAGPPVPDSLIAGGTVTVSGIVGTSVALSVRVVDQNLRAVPNTQVTFRPLTASGTVAGSGVTKTTSAGLATASWTFGPVAGTQRLIVTARGLTDTLRYVATVRTPPVATTITATSDTTPTGAAGTYHAVSVVVRDADSVPFAKASVRFRVKTGGGYIPNTLVSTDKNGVAQVSWMFGGRPLGEQLLTAELVGTTAPMLTFTADVSVGAPAVVQILSGAKQSGHVHTALPVPIVAKVIDTYGNAVPSFPVSCVVTAGGGSVQHPTATTDSTGTATCGVWTVGTTAGTNLLTVSASPARGASVTAVGTP